MSLINALCTITCVQQCGHEKNSRTSQQQHHHPSHRRRMLLGLYQRITDTVLHESQLSATIYLVAILITVLINCTIYFTPTVTLSVSAGIRRCNGGFVTDRHVCYHVWIGMYTGQNLWLYACICLCVHTNIQLSPDNQYNHAWCV